MSFANRILSFYRQLKIDSSLPEGVEVLNPYQDDEIVSLCTAFYKKYYTDEQPRTIILGINPGRFGGGLTGIPFIDPVKLEINCGIPNTLPKKTELSADFILKMIFAFGGLQAFYSHFVFNSVSPLGFTQHGKNLNYYDSPLLLKNLESFILQSLHQQIKLGIRQDVAYCLGEGDNYKYLKRVNEREKIFKRIIPLAHPRFIMQYKRKHLDVYIDDYIKKLKQV
jgi:hypothetical protein